MNTKPEYPARVTRDTDGVYRWVYVISQRQNSHALKVTITVVGGICVIMTALSATMGTDALIVTLLSYVAAMLVTLLVCLAFHRLAADGVRQPFEITDDYIRWVGHGRTDFRYTFRSLRRVRMLQDLDIIELHRLFGVMQVYIPREDFTMVQEIILNRLTDRTEVVYE